MYSNMMDNVYFLISVMIVLASAGFMSVTTKDEQNQIHPLVKIACVISIATNISTIIYFRSLIDVLLVLIFTIPIGVIIYDYIKNNNHRRFTIFFIESITFYHLFIMIAVAVGKLLIDSDLSTPTLPTYTLIAALGAYSGKAFIKHRSVKTKEEMSIKQR